MALTIEEAQALALTQYPDADARTLNRQAHQLVSKSQLLDMTNKIDADIAALDQAKRDREAQVRKDQLADQMARDRYRWGARDVPAPSLTGSKPVPAPGSDLTPEEKAAGERRKDEAYRLYHS